jgi:hypothetical protein
MKSFSALTVLAIIAAVILAVGAVPGWRGAIAGAAGGVLFLLLLVLALGPRADARFASQRTTRRRLPPDIVRHALAAQGDPAGSRIPAIA